jgi:hypothetical protein
MNIRKVIKEIIVELFDNPQLPLDLKKHDRGVDFLYSFSTDDYDYCIPFKKIEANSLQDIALTNNKDINEVIKKSNSIYFVNWGVCDLEGNPYDDMLTNNKEEIYVFNSIFAIFKKFIEDYKPDIIFYEAMGSIKNIYKGVFEKFKLEYKHFEGIQNSFLIKKNIL